MAKKSRSGAGLRAFGKLTGNPVVSLLGGAQDMPGQVRLASREQQPRPPVPPKKRRGR
jgi:hypothetical protein